MSFLGDGNGESDVEGYGIVQEYWFRLLGDSAVQILFFLSFINMFCYH